MRRQSVGPRSSKTCAAGGRSGSRLPEWSGPESRGTRAPNPAGGEEGSTGFSARTCTSAAAGRPSPPRTGPHGPPRAHSQQLRRTPGSRSPGSSGLAALCYQLPPLPGAGRRPASTGSRAKGVRSQVGGLPKTAAPTAPRALPGFPQSFPRLVGSFNGARRARVNSTLRRLLKPLFAESLWRGPGVGM